MKYTLYITDNFSTGQGYFLDNSVSGQRETIVGNIVFLETKIGNTFFEPVIYWKTTESLECYLSPLGITYLFRKILCHASIMNLLLFDYRND